MATMSPPPATAPGAPARLLSLPVLSWALYDLANTIFSMNIVSLYFGVWVVNVMGGTDTLWARANSLSMGLLVLTAPFLGALSDQVGRRLPFLMISTAVCVTATALLGVGGLMTALALFMVANYFFQAGLIFYDATLPTVSTPENRGRVGGLGIGLGYIGSFLGVAAGLLLLERFGYVFVFRMTAVLFALFAVPIFLFVKEPVRRRAKLSGRMVAGAFTQVFSTVRHVRRYPGLGRFLIGRAFYTDAANTLIIFMGIYVTNEMAFTATQMQLLMLTATAAAVAGGFLWGPVVDRRGPKRTLDMVLGVWALTLALAIAVPVLGLPAPLFWACGCLAGIALGGTWAADRPLMLVLSPPAKIGEFYGLYSMIGRFTAVIGPLVWALTAEGLGLGRPAAIGVLLLMVVLAFIVLRKVDDAPRAWAPEDREVAA